MLVDPQLPLVPFCDRDSSSNPLPFEFETWMTSQDICRGLTKRDWTLSTFPGSFAYDDDEGSSDERSDSDDIFVAYAQGFDTDQDESEDDNEEDEELDHSGRHSSRRSSRHSRSPTRAPSASSHNRTWGTTSPSRPSTPIGKTFIKPQGNFLIFPPSSVILY